MQKLDRVAEIAEPVQRFVDLLMNAGVRSFRRTAKRDEPRGIFCAIGRCTDCMMIVNGKPNVRTCITGAADGMRVETQYGYGGRKEQA